MNLEPQIVSKTQKATAVYGKQHVKSIVGGKMIVSNNLTKWCIVLEKFYCPQHVVPLQQVRRVHCDSLSAFSVSFQLVVWKAPKSAVLISDLNTSRLLAPTANRARADSLGARRSKKQNETDVEIPLLVWA